MYKTGHINARLYNGAIYYCSVFRYYANGAVDSIYFQGHVYTVTFTLPVRTMC